LIERVVSGWCELRSVEVVAVRVVVEPLFSWLVALDDGMPGVAGMVGGVLRRRVVTAADVPAEGAAAKVEPPAARSLTLFATGSARRHGRVDRIEVGITVRRGHVASSRVRNAT
jgi:hypothetical protein